VAEAEGRRRPAQDRAPHAQRQDRGGQAQQEPPQGPHRPRQGQNEIGTALHGLKDNSAFEQFERLKTKVERMEAEAEAGSELAEEYTGDRLAHRFKELEQAHVVDDDLLALKRQMGVAPAAPGAPPAAAPLRRPAPPPPPPPPPPPSADCKVSFLDWRLG